MIGLDFILEEAKASKYCEGLKENGILCKETDEKIIRFEPPLMATKEDIDYTLRITYKVTE
jgi:ornithine--oxo-acid transaminase